MTAGKIASQAGHAYLDAYLTALKSDTDRCTQYKQGHGIKVCLVAKNEHHLNKLEMACINRGIPHALIHDLGYTCFEGRTTVTALGVGPIRRNELPELNKMGLMS
jgi:peptidyl-tRNA hydrolase